MKGTGYTGAHHMDIRYIPVEKEHLLVLYKWFNDESFSRWFYRDLPMNTYHLSILIEEEMRQPYPLLFIQNLEKPIGFFRLHDLDFVNRKVEITLGIGEKDAQGRGFGKHMLKFALEYAFFRLNLEQVYLYVYKNNVLAKRLYESFRFTTEGEFRVLKYYKGEALPGYRMRLFRDEYKIHNQNE